MLTFLYVLHFLVCFVLIGVVLLQRGKGQDLGASLGGGSANTIFGSRGAGNFLTRITTASAIIFMGTSLSLSYLGYKSEDVRLFDESEPFVPEGAAPKAEASGLEEIPSDAAAGAVPDAAADAAAAAPGSEGALVEIPTPDATASTGPDAAEAPAAGNPAAGAAAARVPEPAEAPAESAGVTAPPSESAQPAEAAPTATPSPAPAP